ncbi:hypothetical protein NDU88_004227 [Pleurodeles waltl]|uniref:Uncharacterized protein n=1 Tax=Pleurodeles waltl TaxID=8319 RepID=A0AAV7UGI9_PLEWA|nr:hypothetical protein NDU88_004227 [Pleurodeles waltl]
MIRVPEVQEAGHYTPRQRTSVRFPSRYHLCTFQGIEVGGALGPQSPGTRTQEKPTVSLSLRAWAAPHCERFHAYPVPPDQPGGHPVTESAPQEPRCDDAPSELLESESELRSLGHRPSLGPSVSPQGGGVCSRAICCALCALHIDTKNKRRLPKNIRGRVGHLLSKSGKKGHQSRNSQCCARGRTGERSQWDREGVSNKTY